MGSRVLIGHGPVRRRPDDATIPHHDGAHRHLAALEGVSGERDGLCHPRAVRLVALLASWAITSIHGVPPHKENG